MATPYKISVSVGASRFEAEGEEKSVRDDYRLFLEAISSSKTAGPIEQQDDVFRQPDPAYFEIDKAQLERVFLVDAEKNVSLKMLPRGDNRNADALIVILYGFRQLATSHDVNSGNLMDAARKSGLQIDRIDKVIVAHHNLITEGGFKRGKRYGLNNQGVGFAIRTIKNMLG